MGAWRCDLRRALLLYAAFGRHRRWRRIVGPHGLARLRAVPAAFLSLAVVAQALWLRAGKPGPAPKLWATGLAVALSILIILLEFRFAIRITIGVFAATALYAVLLNRAQKKGTLS